MLFFLILTFIPRCGAKRSLEEGFQRSLSVLDPAFEPLTRRLRMKSVGEISQSNRRAVRAKRQGTPQIPDVRARTPVSALRRQATAWRTSQDGRHARSDVTVSWDGAPIVRVGGRCAKS